LERGQEMRLKDKAAIITGSALGMGRGAALHFAREGAKVVVTDVDTNGGKETVELVKKSGGQAAFIQCDVSKSSDVKRMVDFAAKTFGRINVLYNNAALQLWGKDAPVDELLEEDWDRVMAVDVKGAYLCMKYAIPEMMRAGGGSIINISSIAALVGRKQSAYTTAKGGLISLSRLVAKHYAPKKVRCNVICPGPIATQFAGEMSDAKQKELAKEIPLGRYGQIEDITYCAVYLASEESSYVTGGTFVIDGGLTACPTSIVEPLFGFR
jgi:NAD(P)-dependent dehydrogenase (short-subunit alcohol dehydrogenase family)